MTTTRSRTDVMYVTFWGTRGSIPTPGSSTEKYGGNTPCVSIQHRDTTLIFDAGTGIRNLGLDLAQWHAQEDTEMHLHLLLSHTHWDHIQGLPFFQPAYTKGAKLKIYGSPKKESFLEAILSQQMDVDYFPVEMNQLGAKISIMEFKAKTMHIDDLVIDWQEQVCHPGGCVRYRINHKEKRVVYATDVELNKIYGDDIDKPEKQDLATEYEEFIHGADLLIADGQYTEEEYPTRKGFGHTTIPLLLEVAYRSKVKQLAVFHHEPLHSDSMLDNLWAKHGGHYHDKKPHMGVFWAREGMTLAI